ncbi:flagellar filament capping protein FliD [Oceanobacillus timonensis]|uniref:flagellar filament capping protein FliD n=1 Tax=Oceanobacillus timonensis TaxID=1926285 RepID=UPI0009B9943E|nr:flagellar filament capping protein FliD [Oceanobacillus timonensis]
MRIGGLASGIDTDSMVKDLMDAERIPLDKLHQDRTKLEWKRDAFRDVNKLLADFDRNKIFDMKMSDTFNSKIISSTQEDAVIATGSAGADSGTYRIEVGELATSAINVGEPEEGFDPEEPLNLDGPITFRTYGKDASYGEEDGEGRFFKEHRYEMEEGDTLSDVIRRINDDADAPVRMTYDQNSDTAILEATRTGVYNEDGAEVDFSMDDSGLFTALGLNVEDEEGAQNAEFTYNGAYTVESQDNHYELNGVTFQFLNETNGEASLNVTSDIDHTVEKITAFVESYNEIVDEINGSQREEVFRDYPPLTDEQKSDMSEREIELWEEQAKSGMLRGEASLSNGLTSMRSSWYGTVQNEGAFTSLTEVGIETSADYMNGGKLVIDEESLREALAEDAESVQKLFVNNEEGEGRGLINRLEDSVESTISQINQRAGTENNMTLDGYAIGKRMEDINSRIENFERRLESVEARYWKQFSEMERAISNMNQQSSMLMSNFSSGMEQ